MADFLNKLKKGLDKGMATAQAKSNTLIETNKIKSDISATGKQRKEALLQLGTRVYNMSREGQVIGPEALEDLVTTISEAEKKVAELEAKIALVQEAEKEKMEEIKAMGDDVIDVEATEEVVEAAEEAVEEAEDIAVELAKDIDEDK